MQQKFRFFTHFCQRRTFFSIFVSPRSFLPQEGSWLQGCFTGQPRGTDCFYTAGLGGDGSAQLASANLRPKSVRMRSYKFTRVLEHQTSNATIQTPSPKHTQKQTQKSILSLWHASPDESPPALLSSLRPAVMNILQNLQHAMGPSTSAEGFP